ncbi:(5-formylfuran-3-yl)methyl phosphate transaminase [Porphyridium purpureum]|uniref:(5-formylfuran-3-yl)methyl phosphate transaminase n=1 Tax=Porphyridium purpureum TaxID=35688 RepID=A0A5J4YRD5_PORPP|nr:(5-formylfuran-3-yl)methyl phosphate transaminase [Porphyridium purpureum]|eukprot:POR0167..scf236_6
MWEQTRCRTRREMDEGPIKRGRLRLSAHMEHVRPFYVMEVMRRANELSANGFDVCHLEVGQPSTSAPQPVRDEAARLLRQNALLGYTSALGVMELREKIAAHYAEHFPSQSGQGVMADNICITTGSSGGFVLLFSALFQPGDTVGLAAATYPCYRNTLKTLGCNVVSIPLDSTFRVTAEAVEQVLSLHNAQNGTTDSSQGPIRGLILSSPSNPTGAVIDQGELARIYASCVKYDVFFVCDEIYQGIYYGDEPEVSAVEHVIEGGQCAVVNSMSKRFSMPGYRLGWMVLPKELMHIMERLQQNLYINPPTLSQVASVRLWDPESTRELEAHTQRYAQNRIIVLSALHRMSIHESSPAHGGFYVYVDLARFGVRAPPSQDNHEDEARAPIGQNGENGHHVAVCERKWRLTASQLCQRVLEETHVAVTPGVDFEDPESKLGEQRLRISFSRSTQEVKEGMRRFEKWWLDNNFHAECEP